MWKIRGLEGWKGTQEWGRDGREEMEGWKDGREEMEGWKDGRVGE